MMAWWRPSETMRRRLAPPNHQRHLVPRLRGKKEEKRADEKVEKRRGQTRRWRRRWRQGEVMRDPTSFPERTAGIAVTGRVVPARCYWKWPVHPGRPRWIKEPPHLFPRDEDLPSRACPRAGWISMLLPEWLPTAVQPPGPRTRRAAARRRTSPPRPPRRVLSAARALGDRDGRR